MTVTEPVVIKAFFGKRRRGKSRSSCLETDLVGTRNTMQNARVEAHEEREKGQANKVWPFVRLCRVARCRR